MTKLYENSSQRSKDPEKGGRGKGDRRKTDNHMVYGKNKRLKTYELADIYMGRSYYRKV